MEFIESLKDNNSNYTKKIKDSKYLQGKSMVIKEKGLDDICENIISKHEIEYISLTKDHRNKFVIDTKLNISQVFNDYKDKYNKQFNYNLLQTSLQNKNYLSAILFLNEYYKINTIIYNSQTNKYYKTSLKDYTPFICIYKDDTWFHSDDEHNISDDINDINDLSNILTIDTSIYIFKPHLKAISRYKLSDLHIIANEMNIPITNLNKNKLKKELYDEINLKHYKINI